MGPGGYGLNYGGWNGCPYNGSNNINGCNATYGNALFTMGSPALPYQEGYVRKVIDTLNGFDNVLYEVINEGDCNTQAWQYQFIKYIRSYESGKPKQHLVGINGCCSTDDLNQQMLFNSNADFISPLAYNSGSPYYANPPAATGTKIIVSDIDHLVTPRDSTDPSVARIWVWKSFLRGLHIIFMDTIQSVVGGSAVDLPGYENARLAMGHTSPMQTR